MCCCSIRLLPSLLFVVSSCCTLAEARVVSVHLQGQLGNQMFEIAAAYAYALDHEAELRVPELLRDLYKWDITANHKVIFSKVSTATVDHAQCQVFENSSPYQYVPLPICEGLFIRSLCQNEQYFAHRRKEVLELFDMPGRWEALLERHPFLSSSRKIGIHLRISCEPERDYPDVHPVFGAMYVEKALDRLPPAEYYIVASNNIQMAKWILRDLPQTFVFMEDTNRFDDLVILSHCEHLIGTNSSFSWWAAWLGAQEGRRCIFPLPWLFANTTPAHPIPARWETLSCPESILDVKSFAQSGFTAIGYKH